MERAINKEETTKRWDLYGLPKEMFGEDFIDVGCWGGGFVYEAVNRGARFALGVDSVASDNWTEGDFAVRQFLQMDVYSPHFLSLPRFDVMLCAGVLYHVTDPVGLMLRLKALLKDDGMLYLETATFADSEPLVQFCPGNSFDMNNSNWFIPSASFIACLYQEIGFKHIDSFMVHDNRAVWKLKLDSKMHSRMPGKTLPRKKEYMK